MCLVSVLCLPLSGHLYTGTSDGKILHIYKGEVRTLATLGKPPCGICWTSFAFLIWYAISEISFYSVVVLRVSLDSGIFWFPVWSVMHQYSLEKYCLRCVFFSYFYVWYDTDDTQRNVMH